MTPPDKAEYDRQEFIADTDLVGMMSKKEETEEEKYYVYKMSGHYYTENRIPVSKKVLFEGTEKECYEFVKKEMEKPYDYRSVIYAIEHIILAFEKDISPNLRNKLNHWKKNIQEALDKE